MWDNFLTLCKLLSNPTNLGVLDNNLGLFVLFWNWTALNWFRLALFEFLVGALPTLAVHGGQQHWRLPVISLGVFRLKVVKRLVKARTLGTRIIFKLVKGIVSYFKELRPVITFLIGHTLPEGVFIAFLRGIFMLLVAGGICSNLVTISR